MRGLLSAKVPNSSFAEAHRVPLSEPTHMEDEDEDQENLKEDERDVEECKVEKSEQTLRMNHGWYDAHTLSQCHVRHSNECVQSRENETCAGVLFTKSV